jgi:ATP adenylyltransferase
MVAPVRHIGTMDETTPEEGRELWLVATRTKQVLSEAMRPDGFNLGINQGKVAGAGVLDHLHIHIVPRWNGDVNFMPVIADVRVIPQALEDAWTRLKPLFDAIAG